MVDYIDDASQIHGNWLQPYKSSIAIIPEIDSFSVVDGGLEEIFRNMSDEIYAQMAIDGDIDNDRWFDLMRDSIEKYFNREIDDELKLMEIGWNVLFDAKTRTS